MSVTTSISISDENIEMFLALKKQNINLSKMFNELLRFATNDQDISSSLDQWKRWSVEEKARQRMEEKQQKLQNEEAKTLHDTEQWLYKNPLDERDKFWLAFFKENEIKCPDMRKRKNDAGERELYDHSLLILDWNIAKSPYLGTSRLDYGKVMEEGITIMLQKKFIEKWYSKYRLTKQGRIALQIEEEKNGSDGRVADALEKTV